MRILCPSLESSISFEKTVYYTCTPKLQMCFLQGHLNSVPDVGRKDGRISRIPLHSSSSQVNRRTPQIRGITKSPIASRIHTHTHPRELNHTRTHLSTHPKNITENKHTPNTYTKECVPTRSPESIVHSWLQGLRSGPLAQL